MDGTAYRTNHEHGAFKTDFSVYGWEVTAAHYTRCMGLTGVFILKNSRYYLNLVRTLQSLTDFRGEDRKAIFEHLHFITYALVNY